MNIVVIMRLCPSYRQCPNAPGFPKQFCTGPTQIEAEKQCNYMTSRKFSTCHKKVSVLVLFYQCVHKQVSELFLFCMYNLSALLFRSYEKQSNFD